MLQKNTGRRHVKRPRPVCVLSPSESTRSKMFDRIYRPDTPPREGVRHLSFWDVSGRRLFNNDACPVDASRTCHVSKSSTLLAIYRAIDRRVVSAIMTMNSKIRKAASQTIDRK